LISKIDILNRSFSKSFRGYDRGEVDQALQEAAEAFGELSEERKQLNERVAALEQDLEEHRSREKTLRDTLVTTQKMIDDLKATAQKEAQLIIDAANSKADNMLNQAHMRLAQLHEDISELKKQRTQFEVKLRSILDTHMSLLEMDKQEREALEESENKLKFIRKAGS
jgi:cell division initiation protein